jgi:hypothetical protein
MRTTAPILQRVFFGAFLGLERVLRPMMMVVDRHRSTRAILQRSGRCQHGWFPVAANGLRLRATARTGAKDVSKMVIVGFFIEPEASRVSNVGHESLGETITQFIQFNIFLDLFHLGPALSRVPGSYT